jgi:hypothetical protein
MYRPNQANRQEGRSHVSPEPANRRSRLGREVRVALLGEPPETREPHIAH